MKQANKLHLTSGFFGFLPVHISWRLYGPKAIRIGIGKSSGSTHRNRLQQKDEQNSAQKATAPESIYCWTVEHLCRTATKWWLHKDHLLLYSVGWSDRNPSHNPECIWGHHSRYLVWRHVRQAILFLFLLDFCFVLFPLSWIHLNTELNRIITHSPGPEVVFWQESNTKGWFVHKIMCNSLLLSVSLFSPRGDPQCLI